MSLFKDKTSTDFPKYGRCLWCRGCRGSPCNLKHMFFSCPALTNFWQIYFDTISKVFAKTLHISPHIGIFGLPEEYTQYTTKELGVIAFTSLIAKRHLLLNWKSTTAPSSTQWIKEAMSFLKVEKIRYIREWEIWKNSIINRPLIFLQQCNPCNPPLLFFFLSFFFSLSLSSSISLLLLFIYFIHFIYAISLVSLYRLC